MRWLPSLNTAHMSEMTKSAKNNFIIGSLFFMYLLVDGISLVFNYIFVTSGEKKTSRAVANETDVGRNVLLILII